MHKRITFYTLHFNSKYNFFRNYTDKGLFDLTLKPTIFRFAVSPTEPTPIINFINLPEPLRQIFVPNLMSKLATSFVSWSIILRNSSLLFLEFLKPVVKLLQLTLFTLLVSITMVLHIKNTIPKSYLLNRLEDIVQPNHISCGTIMYRTMILCMKNTLR